MGRLNRIMNARSLRVAAVVGALIGMASCSDQPPVTPKSPLAPGQSRLSIAPRFQAPAPGGPTVVLNRLRGVLIGSNGDSVVVEALFQGDSAVLRFTVQFPGASARYTLRLTGYDKSDKEAYSATQEYIVKPGENDELPAPNLVYTAADSKLTNLRIAPSSLALDAGAGASLSVSGTGANNVAISPILVGWSSKDASIASVDQNGSVRAGQFQGSTYIVARSYTGVADSVLVKVRAPVAKVVLAPASLELIRGSAGAAAAELRDAGDHLIDDRTASWSSSDPTVATVNASGAIRALKVGSATITASAEGKSATLAVRVVSPIDHIELTPASLSFASIGESRSVAARLVVRPGGSADGITATYSSSNPAVATVGANGAVTAIQNGSATITASADGLTAEASVTVRQLAATITVSPKSAVANALGDTRTFSATVSDALGNPMPTAAVSWSSSNPAAVSVSGGTAVARGNGSATITATVDGKSDAATMTVSQVPRLLFASISNAPLQVGQSAALTARVADANGATIGPVHAQWSTATPTIASISDTTLTALSPGVARITATSSGLTTALNVQINPVPGTSTSLTITPATVEKLPNGTQQFAVTAGGTGPFTWTVNGVAGGNTTYGTINSTGFYTAPSAVPSPATFDVCAVQASPTATGCAHVTINPIPTSGSDVLVFNDVNMFDNTASQDPNNQRFYQNIVGYSAAGSRATQTGVMFYFGHNSAWFPSGVSAGGFMNGYTVTNVSTATLDTIPSNYKVIFLWTPTTSFSNSEINAMKQFSADGGRIVFIGEHSGFYGSGIPVENAFLQKMGAQMTNLGGFYDCAGDDGFPNFPTLPASRLTTTHQVMSGMTGLTLACASELSPGPNDFVLFRSFNGAHVLGAAAKIDVTPLPVVTSVRARPATTQPRVLTQPGSTWTDPARRPPPGWPNSSP